MTKKQLERLGKIIKLLGPAKTPNMDIYLHNVSEKEAKEIMRKLPKAFRKRTNITENGNNWKEAKTEGMYGFGRLTVSVFYSKEKGGE